ncbi:MAG: response regulator [Proteobacteria bacterium]|nr:response regulator [Pseudomonadota bacterium]
MSSKTDDTVLVIDDDDLFRHSMVKYLEDSDFSILQAENGRLGLDTFRREKPGIVLVDLRMPETNGFEVLASVREEAPETPIIVISGEGVLDDAIKALKLGAWDYLTKPIHNMELLRHTIGKALERAEIVRSNERYQKHLENQAIKLKQLGEELLQDIKQRKETEEKLRQSEERYRKILEEIEEIYYEVDLTGAFTFFNEAVVRSLGYSKDELMGMTYRQYLDSKNAEQVYEYYNRVYKTDLPATFDYEMTKRDGTCRQIESSISLIKDKNGDPIGFRGIAHDISRRKQIERNLKIAQESAEIANITKSEFLANISHEIRTPLNAILGMTEVLQETETTMAQREYLNIIKNSGDTLLMIITDILDFTKIESGKFKLEEIDFKIRDNIGETLKGFVSMSHDKGLTLAFDVDPDVPDEVIGDPYRLRQILVNLVGNAIKFTHEGEAVVKVGVDAKEGKRISLHFQIKDTGIGINEEKQKIIFDAFSQADSSTTREFGGIGLGLSISSRLVKLTNGRIWVESWPGKETTVHFTTWFTMITPSPDKSLTVPQLDILGLPILVVESNATQSLIMERVLSNWGTKPEIAKDGSSAIRALEKAKQQENDFKIVLVDFGLPDMDGFTLSRKIKDDLGDRSPGIILLSSMGQGGDAEHCRELGISAYLLKPVKHSELLGSIQATLYQKEDGTEEPTLVTRHTFRENQASS